MRGRVIIAAAALLLSGCAGRHGLNPDDRQTVQVDGASYKVRVQGDKATVARQSVVMPQPSLDERDRMRRAARQATGCTLADDMWLGSILTGKLQCEAAR